MNYKIIIFFFIFLVSCTTNQIKNSQESLNINAKFINSGFTLIYNENLFLKKIVDRRMNDRDLIVYQKNLSKGVSVKILNPENNKSLIAQIGKKASYPKFNNSVISKRIASELELRLDEPFIIIEEIVHNSAFIAKKTKTYEEEKKVANKAPVEKITVKNLNETNKNKVKIKKSNFNYSIKIADFHFIESAKTMKNRIIVESNIKNIDILKLSKNKFRVILGPYLDLKSLQKEYNKLDKLKFENIEILRNV